MRSILALAMLSSSAQAAEVLIYNDNGYSWAEQAALALGHTVMTYQADGPGFGAAYAGGFGDVVIIEAPYNWIPTEATTVLSAHVTAGLPYIYMYWDLDGDPTSQAILGVSSLGDYYTAETVGPFGSDPYGLFAGVPTLTPTTDVVNDDGDYLSGGTQAGILGSGNSAIAFSNGGFVNGFSPINFQGGDADVDGVEDVVELLKNEMNAFGGARPTITLTGAPCPSSVTVAATGFTPGGNVAIVRSNGTGAAVIPSGPCAGTTLGLGTAGLGLVTMVSANPSGNISYAGSVSSSICTKYLQFVDMSTCTPSNVDQF